MSSPADVGVLRSGRVTLMMLGRLPADARLMLMMLEPVPADADDARRMPG